MECLIPSPLLCMPRTSKLAHFSEDMSYFKNLNKFFMNTWSTQIYDSLHVTHNPSYLLEQIECIYFLV